MSSVSPFSWSFLLASLAFLPGCAKSTSNELTAVSGKVFYHGAPLTTGSLVFTPDATLGSSGSLVRAEILADGAYRLKTGDQAGIAAGHYRVTVACVSTTATGLRSVLPDKYRDPDHSDLDCEVRAGHENIFNFNLE